MIPIRDINPTRTRPVLIWALIGMNAAVFLAELVLGLQETVNLFGLVPDDFVGWLTGNGEEVTRRLGRGVYFVREAPSPFAPITPLTSMFMHGGWFHIISNMWFLWVFGDNLEDTLGRGRFILFYLLCGIGADVGQVMIDPSSRVPMVGASGAISGVLAGYVMLFPHARVLTLVPIFIFIQFVELPAFLFIFIWFGLQLLQGYMSLGQVGTGQGGVAFFAHIGGFVTGLALIRLFVRRTPRRRRRETRPRFDDGYWH